MWVCDSYYKSRTRELSQKKVVSEHTRFFGRALPAFLRKNFAKQSFIK